MSKLTSNEYSFLKDLLDNYSREVKTKGWEGELEDDEVMRQLELISSIQAKGPTL